MERGRVAHLCVSKEKGVQKTAVEQISLRVGHGIEGDAHAGTWHRQVSVLDLGDIDEMRDGGLDLDPGAFAENVAIDGLPLATLGLGTTLRVGEAVVRISQIGKRCHKPCAISRAAGYCIMPSRGVFARVISSGEVRKGDDVEALEVVPRDDLQAVVVTMDTVAEGTLADDASLGAALFSNLGARLYAIDVVKGGPDAAARRVRHFCSGRGIDVVLCDTSLDDVGVEGRSGAGFSAVTGQQPPMAALVDALGHAGRAAIVHRTLVLHDVSIPDIETLLPSIDAQIRDALQVVREERSVAQTDLRPVP